MTFEKTNVELQKQIKGVQHSRSKVEGRTDQLEKVFQQLQKEHEYYEDEFEGIQSTAENIDNSIFPHESHMLGMGGISI